MSKECGRFGGGSILGDNKCMRCNIIRECNMLVTENKAKKVGKYSVLAGGDMAQYKPEMIVKFNDNKRGKISYV